MKFPNLIHVTIEEPEHDEPFLLVREGGACDVDETQRAAIYKRVDVGKIIVQRKYQWGGKRKAK